MLSAYGCSIFPLCGLNNVGTMWVLSAPHGPHSGGYYVDTIFLLCALSKCGDCVGTICPSWSPIRWVLCGYLVFQRLYVGSQHLSGRYRGRCTSLLWHCICAVHFCPTGLYMHRYTPPSCAHKRARPCLFRSLVYEIPINMSNRPAIRRRHHLL